MSNATAPNYFPRTPLIGAAGLVACVLALAAIGRATGPEGIATPSQPVRALDLAFIDQADGGILVRDMGAGRTVETIAPGADNFLRATVRGLAQQRKRESLGAAAPFRLTAWADGRLTLEDPATGRHVELEAFGGTNEAAFAKLLDPKGGAS